jgi:hypothetical protein
MPLELVRALLMVLRRPFLFEALAISSHGTDRFGVEWLVFSFGVAAIPPSAS